MNQLKQLISKAALPISIVLSIGIFSLFYSEGGFGRGRRSGVFYAISDLIGFAPTIFILSAFIGCISYALIKDLRSTHQENNKNETRSWNVSEFISEHYMKIVLTLILVVLVVISVQIYHSKSSETKRNTWSDSSWGDGW